MIMWREGVYEVYVRMKFTVVMREVRALEAWGGSYVQTIETGCERRIPNASVELMAESAALNHQRRGT